MSMEKEWTTKDGAKIPIKEMTDSHIKNTMNMLWRIISETDEAICSVGEMTIGSFGIMQAHDAMERASEWNRAFQKELKRRSKSPAQESKM